MGFLWRILLSYLGLTGTAFLHSVMVSEKKGMLKFWNIWLVIGTYGLTVFGTFLTRSGIVSKCFMLFASTDIGPVFLIYLALVILAGIILTYTRRSLLSSDAKIRIYFFQEKLFFLFNNLIFSKHMLLQLFGELCFQFYQRL